MATAEAKKLNILSFDGGGSRGLMEAHMIHDIMNLATQMRDIPHKIKSILEVDLDLQMATTLQSLKELTDSVQDPVHPTEAFNYIMGTSTGALIAYGLVGGGQDKDGKRIPMPTKDIIKSYVDLTPRIFTRAKSDIASLVLHCGLKSVLPMVPYTQDVLERELLNIYGNTRTNEIGNINTCIAGAVVRRFNQDPSNPDMLQIFDINSKPPQYVRELLKATSCAPVYFKFPTRMGLYDFIDGGITGNNSVGEGIPRLYEIWPGARLVTVLNLAPPVQDAGKKIQDMSYHCQKNAAGLRYIISQATDGTPIYVQAEKKYPGTF